MTYYYLKTEFKSTPVFCGVFNNAATKAPF